MLRTLPKHKGTEHLQADIRTRIKELTDELSGPRKGGAHTGPAHVVHPDGAGTPLQVKVQRSSHLKCERCWHYRADVGDDPAHAAICGRCVANLFGAGEPVTRGIDAKLPWLARDGAAAAALNAAGLTGTGPDDAREAFTRK